ncbi:MAG: hypothetical protein CMH57_07690 [Myxococcales bacterium]|nr:hypothetical protein [Myxococcales bacterium]
MVDDPPHTKRQPRRALASATDRAHAFAQAASEADQVPFQRGLDRETILELYEGLVVQIVHNLQRAWSVPWSHVDDMKANGYLGLLEAYERFDPEQGSTFATFSYYRIKGSVVDGLRDAGVIRRRKELRRRLSGACDLLAEEARTVRPVGSELGTSLERIDTMVRNMGTVWLIIQDAQLRADEASARHAPARRLLKAELRQQLHDAIDQLDEVERAVIQGHYLEERSLVDIASEHGYSRSWMSRVHTRALERLAELLKPDPP